MPIHDWTRVTSGTFHDFHGAWITHIKEALNRGLLPSGYFAMQEQHAGNIVPDVLTLTSPEWTDAGTSATGANVPEGALALAEAPPQVSLRVGINEEDTYRLRRRTISIRQEPDNRLVAMIEILSPGNKEGAKQLESFVHKSVEAVRNGIHLLIVDLFPPSACNPNGIHGAIWDDTFEQPQDRPLTLVSYNADEEAEAFIEPIRVGQRLPDMPVFLDSNWYVNVPLEATYEMAWQGLPQPYRKILEAN